MESQKEQKVRADNLHFFWRHLKFCYLSEQVSSSGKKKKNTLVNVVYLFIFCLNQIQDGIYMC